MPRPVSTLTLIAPLALSVAGARADAQKDLEDFRTSELLRLENPSVLGHHQRNAAIQFAQEYREKFGRDPAGPSAGERAAYRLKLRAKARAAVQAERQALGGIEPLPKEVPFPKEKGRRVSSLDELAATLRLKGLDVAIACVRPDVDWSHLWKPLLDDAVLYWERAGEAAFQDDTYLAGYLAQGYRTGFQGFPKNPDLADSLISMIPELVRTRTSKSGPKVRLPKAVPARPPREVLDWARKHGMPHPLSPAQVEADRQAGERDRFYQILKRMEAGKILPDAELEWAQEHERMARGLPRGSRGPQWELARKRGAPGRELLAQKELERKQAEQRERAAQAQRDVEDLSKLRRQIAGLQASRREEDFTYNFIARELYRVHGTDADWSDFAARIHPAAGKTSLVGSFDYAGQEALARKVERAYDRYLASTQAAARRPSGGSRGSSGGTSTYDQWKSSNDRYEQYQKDSFMRGGSPNSPDGGRLR